MFTAIFKPAIILLNGFSNKVLNVFGLEAKEEISGARTPAELASLVRRSAAMGTLDAGTANFVARTLNFSDRTAADVMTPAHPGRDHRRRPAGLGHPRRRPPHRATRVSP